MGIQDLNSVLRKMFLVIDLFICSLFVCPTEKAAVASATKGAAGTTQVRFKLEYHTAYGQHVAITGNQPELGSWNAKSALKYARSRGFPATLCSRSTDRSLPLRS